MNKLLNSHFISSMASQLMGVAFPPICRLCNDSKEAFPDSYICQSCLGNLNFIPHHRCLKCGLPNPSAHTVSMDCCHCAPLKFHFDYAQSVLFADQNSMKLIHKLKYRQATWLARTIARIMLCGCKALFQGQSCPHGWDIIVPVPLHSKRLKERGFNQSDIIARYLAQSLEIPVRYKSIKRIKFTETQTGFGRAQRFNNIKNAFSPGPQSYEVTNKNVILLDDVMTTGATLNECAKQLKLQGSKSITAISAIRGQYA